MTFTSTFPSLLLLASLCPTIAMSAPPATAFFCAPVSESQWASFVEEVNTKGKKVSDGVVKLPDDVRFDALCLRDVSVMGSFGIMGITGRSCSASEQEFVSATESVLGIKPQPHSEPHVLAWFPLPNEKREPGVLTIYRGEPSFLPKATGPSTTVSFSCMRAVGGPQ